ncbi:cold shock domain-containing protein [Halalkalibacter urbisdiaboli]|uniref:cold shock domain-containing protein n=1 Tax=Halalkalibacter urbisdiaboli TaxID=1960589 RepID=UPI000B45328B|nr:cold shock domain-containing protein [Halalkalibacter urbisdiaboli]
MSDESVIGLPSFDNRKREYKPWQGDKEMLEALSYIKGTRFRCPRKQTGPQRQPNPNRLKWFNEEGGYGVTVGDVFVHISNVVEGTPVQGATVECDVVETKKGKMGLNVRINNKRGVR